MSEDADSSTGKAKKIIWKRFLLDEYEKAACEMVHFSAKLVNSNTPGFGIRLSSENTCLNLPYVCVNTIERCNIPMDYTSNSGKTATIVKQINAVRHARLEQFEGINQEDVDLINTCESILDSAYETKQTIGIRLRQVILQDAEGNDISATPLPCGGLSRLINERIIEALQHEKNIDGNNETNETEVRKKLARRAYAYLGVGGANPQNVGLNARAMQKPLMFSVPTITPHMRRMKQLLAIYYQGIPIKPNKKILIKFIEWQDRLLIQHFNRLPSNLKTREIEKKFLTALTQDFLVYVAKIEELLLKHIEELPEPQKFSPQLSKHPIQAALLDNSLRNTAWKNFFAKKFYETLLQPLWINKKPKKLEGVESWINIIRDVL